ncbi:SIMPL domain-containing protein [Treponema sp. Marseille-Q4130]|uniref:SIMPL domain-containing protein n=1 Tax=Treponema sp. Marseille-Q4130 TaxID=2766702 RepID=UPI0016528399|nr:SIMPL domain-containing protein [Treponema sp. Marseille-Q4130]MBC6719547.1 SIMPL domain-containing protein [Treponema sp. Marseille-Q4130]
MKRFIKIIIAAVVLFSSLSCSLVKKAEASSRTITVTGRGVSEAEPDKASVVVSVVTQEWVAKTAADRNSEIMTRVRAALVASGVNANDITTTNYSIYRQESWDGGRQSVGRYRVRNEMKIVVHNTALVSDVIDTAISAGANELTSLTFTVADDTALIREARTLAVRQAQETAALLAGASGCKIGEAITITEESGGGGISMMNYAPAAMSTRAATPISSGKIEVSSTVTITYALQ